MDLPFRISLAIVFLAFVAHRGYYHRKLPPSKEDTLEVREGGVPSILAGIFAIAGLVSLAFYLVAPKWMSWAAIPVHSLIRWLGFAIAGMGFGLLQWSQRVLGTNWSADPRITKQQEFVMTGPYHWIRHPIYTSFLLILGSSLLLSANWFIGTMWIGMAAIEIRTRIQFEEARMRSRFGMEYEAYIQRTGGLFPRIGGMQSTRRAGRE